LGYSNQTINNFAIYSRCSIICMMTVLKPSGNSSVNLIKYLNQEIIGLYRTDWTAGPGSKTARHLIETDQGFLELVLCEALIPERLCCDEFSVPGFKINPLTSMLDRTIASACIGSKILGFAVSARFESLVCCLSSGKALGIEPQIGLDITVINFGMDNLQSLIKMDSEYKPLL
jgi:hypothetical protein